MYFRLTKHVFLHIGIIGMAVLSFLTPASRVFWQTFFFALLHELCHCMAALLLRVPVSRLTLMPYGCHLRLGRTDFLSETKIAAAGPIGSFLLFLLFRESEAGRINLLLCLFNLLPALPLDGGRLLRLILWRCIGVFRGNRILRRAGIFTGVSLFLFAGLRPSLFCAFVAFLPLSYAVSVPMPSPLLQKKAIRTCAVKTFHVRRTDSLLSLSRFYSPFYYALFFVAEENIFLSEDIVNASLRQNAAATVADAMTPNLFFTGKLPPCSR